MNNISNSDEMFNVIPPPGRGTSYKVCVVPLELALPGREVRQIGVLLLDIEADRLYCEIRPVIEDAGASEILHSLMGDFIGVAKQRGGRFTLDRLQEILSNTLQTADSEELFVQDHPILAIKQILTDRISAVVTSYGESFGARPLVRQVLVVEDNPADVWLIKAALREYSSTTAVTVAIDGDQAVQLLGSVGTDIAEPDLVLLDLNLPKRSGHEVLEILRANPRLRSTPVAVLSSSSWPGDVARAYEQGANYYVQKAANLVAFNASVSAVCSRFFVAAA